MTKDQVKILHKITEEITSALYGKAQEERYPTSNQDASDDRLAYLNKKADNLRRIRGELETLFAGDA